jgi:hypothetical protein
VISRLPADATLDTAVAAIRALGGACADATAVADRVQLLTAEISPDKARSGRSLGDQYEDSLYYGEWFRWQWLKVRAAFGDGGASAAMREELEVAGSGGVQVSGGSDGDVAAAAAAAGADLPSYALSKRLSEAYGECAVLRLPTL